MRWRYGFYVLTFACFALAVVYQYDHKFQSQTLAIEASLRQGMNRINDLVRSSVVAVDAMRLQAESLFRDPRTGRSPSPLRLMLSERPAWGGFALPSLPAGMAPHTVGNLTGDGPPTGRSVEWEREIDVALGLNPLFQEVLKEIHNAVWVYYTSGRKFINVCPWVSDTEFHYTPDLLKHEFYADGLSDRNPERKLFWTKAYIDLYGKGMMVTVAAPVDDGKGVFRGTVALDLTLDVLSAFSRSALNPDQPGTVMLVNVSGQLLAHPSLVSSSDATVKMADHILPEPLRGLGGRPPAGEASRLRTVDGDLVFWERLDRAPWTLIYFVEKSVVQGQALMRMMPEAAVFVFLLLSLFLVERQFRTSDVLRASQAALQESERRLATLLGNLPGMAYRCRNDRSWTMEFVSSGVEALTGYRADEILGNAKMAYSDIIHPDDRERVWQETQEALNNGRPFSFVYRITTAAGKVDTVWEQGRGVYAEDGGMAAVEGFVLDVTERVQAENALRESETKFRHLIEFAPIGIFLSVDYKYIYTNPTGAKIVGLADPGEIVGRSVTAFHHPKDKARADARVGKLLGGEVREVPRIEFKILKTDGGERDLDAVSTIIDWGGERAVLAMVNDITDRKAAERALAESEERFFLALENIPDVIVIYDPDLRIRYVNAAVRAITGLPPDHFIGKRDEDLWPPEASRTFPSTLRDALRSGAVCSFETEIAWPGAKPRYLRITGVPVLDGRGAVREVLGIIHDLTEPKLMEAQLRQAQKMEAVGQLAGGTAHDFNNLLQVILGSLDLIRRERDGDENVMRFVEAATKAVRHGGWLTQQLLAFSRQQTLRPQTVDLNRLIEQMVKMLQRVLGEDIEIETALEAGIPPVRIDPGGLENALLNLALNARAAMPKGGTLKIGTARRTLEEDAVSEEGRLPCGSYVEIAVSDTGCGMEPDVQAHAFEPFFTTKEVGEGSGLGLSMVYGFVKQSEGQATLESAVDEGTTVRMIFPAAEPATAETAEEPRAKARPRAGNGTILVVEDDPDVRSTTVAILEMLGYRTLEAGDGLAALEILRRGNSVDLLFSDVVMPKGMDGIEMAREATRRRPDLKVLLTSGYPEAVLEKTGLPGTGFPLLKKPYSNDELAEALRAALDG